MIKLIILDRDGVINFDSPDFIKSPEEWRPIPGSLEAIAKFNQAGYKVVVTTNQSGLGRGLYDENTLVSIHEKMLKAIQQAGGHIDHIFVCPHLPDANCDCRKPKPGLLYQVAKYFNVNLQDLNIPAIGDSLRDLEAAKAANCRPILVHTGNGLKTAQNLTNDLKNIEQFKDLWAAALAISK